MIHFASKSTFLVMLKQNRGITYLLQSYNGNITVQFLLFPLFSQFIVDFSSAENHSLYFVWILACGTLVWNQSLKFRA